MIFDTHAHYTSTRFADHLAELLDSLPGQNVCNVVDCATDYASALASLSLGEKYPWIYTAAGIHPESLIEEDASTNTQFGGDWQAELDAIKPLFSNPHVVAVGECGLDYHWPVPKDSQHALFQAHLKLARELDLPVLMHDRDAHQPFYELLKEYKPKGIVHAYSGSVDDAQWITAQGLFLGIGGVVTFKNARKLQEVVTSIPLKHLVLETDCPYMAPVPFRGKECNSGMIFYVAQKIAELKNMEVDTVLRVTCDNAKRLFSIA